MTLTETQWHTMGHYVRSYILRTAEVYGHQNAIFRATARWTHTLNVLGNVRLILDGEAVSPESREVCEVAALFHDVDHYTVQQEYHAQRGAETAARFLRKEGFSTDFIERVAHCIREHLRDMNDDEPAELQVQRMMNEMSYEACIVFDADTLDKVGASNILQVIASLSSTQKRPMVEIARELCCGWPIQRAELWFEMLTTPTGKRLGAERLALAQQFVKQLGVEVTTQDPFPVMPNIKVTQELPTVRQ